MKKNIIRITVILLMIGASPGFASTTKESIKEPVNMDAKRASIMIERIEEIGAMDKSSMSHHEKRMLRREVVSMNKALRSSSNGGGIYISVGAAILIVLLLILLL